MRPARLCSAFALARRPGGWRLAVVGDGVRWTLPTVEPAAGEGAAETLLAAVAELTGGEPRLLDPLVPPLLAERLETPQPWWWMDVRTGMDETLCRYEYLMIVQAVPVVDTPARAEPEPDAVSLRWADKEALLRLSMSSSTRALGAALARCADSLVAGRLDAGVLSALSLGLNRPGVGGLPAQTRW
jgi:hypothetical protein